jgi:quercetin dioxygenase-like cupin family protein
MPEIHIPTREELDRRVSRFAKLQPMSTATKDLAWVPQDAMDIVFARKLMPIILDDTKNPFGNEAPIFGAAHTTMFISILPLGQGPCLHSHNDTFETFMVLDGRIEYEIGEPVAHRITLDKWDVFSCPPRVYRGFHNVGSFEFRVGYAACGLIEVKSSLPAMRKSTVRMVLKRV